MALTKEEVAKVAHLARLDISDAMAESMAHQLSDVLDYAAKLNELNTDDVTPLSHPGKLSNVFRDDVPAPSLPNEAALQNAPDKQSGSFRVPRVIE